MMCTCGDAQQGDVCKHQLKVLKTVHPHLRDAQIVHALGTYKGTPNSGISYLLAPSQEALLRVLSPTELADLIETIEQPKPWNIPYIWALLIDKIILLPACMCRTCPVRRC